MNKKEFNGLILIELVKIAYDVFTNEIGFNSLILIELVKIANDVFTNEIEKAPGTYTAAELAKLLLICFSVFGGLWLLPIYLLFCLALGFYFGVKYLTI